MRQTHESLGQVAEALVEECLQLKGEARPCYDNVTLVIVSLADYLVEF